MGTDRQPRFANIAMVLGTDNMVHRQQHIDECLAWIAERPDRQYNYFFLAAAYEVLALEAYALGHEIGDVIRMFRDAVEARLRVLQLRGTGHYTRTKPARRPGDEVVTTVLTDFGTGCSWYGYESACWAHMVGAQGLAENIVALIWDPPDASYIGSRSEICTPQQQKLAYAFRTLGTPAYAESRSQLRRLSELWRVRGFPKPVAYQAGLVQAIGDGNGAEFLRNLDSIHAWHTRMAQRHENLLERSRFLCLPALGLGALALTTQTIRIEDWPEDSVYLPLELIRDDSRNA
jgi:hypothetical protein